MSAVLDTSTRDARVAQVLADHDGNAEAALLACIIEIDRLGGVLIRAAHESSYGYSRGRLRRPAGTSSEATSTERKEPLDV